MAQSTVYMICAHVPLSYHLAPISLYSSHTGLLAVTNKYQACATQTFVLALPLAGSALTSLISFRLLPILRS